MGGGRIAARKIQALLEANAKVTVISPSLSRKIDPKKVHWISREYLSNDLTGYSLIFAATGDLLVNRQVTEDAQDNQWVNDISNKYDSNFFNVAVVRHEDYVIGISTTGKSPSAAKKLKERIQAWLVKGN
ncbi:hypothetical protein IV55_GL001585 [Furfurilactobacillus siliginis]|uniref:precorrin-2 dehydrogenase n=1 Tax=Furfurilactobacillus siliginis TaxID=348151 RepID=A0A0R2LBY2_9LACO|nr:hypothetical protein IV55_GL001585 [Furfurilactobacillus siliginis]